MKEILNLIQKDINIFNYYLKESLKTNINDFNGIIEYILATKGKQLRPVLGILLANNLGEYNKQQQDFLIAIELIHNATLFHDDVIDNSKQRRYKATLKEKYSNKISILTGDYFLSTAIQIINTLENVQINKLFATYIKSICEGEIEQNLTLFTIPSIEDYIEKTRKKTALLFELTTLGICTLSNASNQQLKNSLGNFGENLGILFQIKDDLNNFKISDDKPYLNDLHDGVITAPIIYTNEEYDIGTLLENQQFEDIITLMNKSHAIEKTEKLLKKYYENSLLNIKSLEDNNYKNALLKLLTYLRNN